MGSGLIIGVDGGGTHTVAVAARADGTIVGSATGPGINYYNIGMEDARENLHQTVEALLARCGIREFDRLVLGMSALDRDADAELTRRFAGDRFDPSKLRMHSDAYIALVGATLGEPGIIVICGTGSILLLLDAQGRQHAYLGWGTLLGDPGSGYMLAIEGLRAAVDAWEAMGPETSLTAAAERHFAFDAPRMLIDRLYDPNMTPDRIAQFGRSVLEAADHGDAVAAGILRGNMRYLAEKCARVIGKHPEAARVTLHGGVFQHNAGARELFGGALLSRRPNARIVPPEFPPAVGAVLCCFLENKSLGEDVLRRLQSSKGGL